MLSQFPNVSYPKKSQMSGGFDSQCKFQGREFGFMEGQIPFMCIPTHPVLGGIGHSINRCLNNLFLHSMVFLWCFSFHSHSIKFSTMSTVGFNLVIFFSFIHLSRFVYIHMYMYVPSAVVNNG